VYLQWYVTLLYKSQPPLSKMATQATVTATTSTYLRYIEQYSFYELSQETFVDAVLYLCITATMIPDAEVASEIPITLLDSWINCFVNQYQAYVTQLEKGDASLSPHAYWKETRKHLDAGTSNPILDFDSVLEIEGENTQRSKEIKDICVDAADEVLERRYMPKTMPLASRRLPATLSLSDSVRRAAIDRLFHGHPPKLAVGPQDLEDDTVQTSAGIVAYQRWRKSAMAAHQTIIADYVDAGLKEFAEKNDILAFWRLYHGFVSGLCDGW